MTFALDAGNLGGGWACPLFFQPSSRGLLEEEDRMRDLHVYLALILIVILECAAILFAAPILMN